METIFTQHGCGIERDALSGRNHRIAAGHMRTGLTKQEKTTDIWFDEKDPLIHIRTHNTDLKKRLLAYSRRYPANCQQTDTDPETGCMEFDIEKGRFSFRLTAPYSEERREATRRYARENSTTNLLK